MTRRRYISGPDVEITADVTIDPDDLHDQGWHHEEECGSVIGNATTTSSRGEPPSLYDVAQELHQQIHPAESLWLNRCTVAPCSDLAAAWG